MTNETAWGDAHAGVIVHLDEGESEQHRRVLRNIDHLLDTLGEDTPIELVTHGAGLGAVLKSSPHAETLIALLERGVRADACANTMQEKQIDENELLPGVTVVPAGIAQAVIRQREGWSYVRP